MLRGIIYRVSSPLKLLLFRLKWRLNNRHNGTNAVNNFENTKVLVGRYTYGNLHIMGYRHEDEMLIIGDFVSIAPGVVFILGGNHVLNTLSTYPFKTKIGGEISEAITKGKVIVEDDVWIGTNVIILSGVTLKQGCVVAAGSVVTRSFPSYSIIGGNPAKIIKKRFSDEIINKLNCFDFSKLTASAINMNMDSLYIQIENARDVDFVIDAVSKQISK